MASLSTLTSAHMHAGTHTYTHTHTHACTHIHTQLHLGIWQVAVVPPVYGLASFLFPSLLCDQRGPAHTMQVPTQIKQYALLCLV